MTEERGYKKTLRDIYDKLNSGQLSTIPGKKDDIIDGRNLVLTNTYQDVWRKTGVMVWPSAAALPSIVSSSDNDGAGDSSGVLTVAVTGLDASFEEVTEVVTMNGTTPVNLATSMIRIQRIVTATVGSNNEAVGDIEISIGGDVQARIPAEENLSWKAMYTIPTGTTIRIERVFLNTYDQKKCTFRVQTKATTNDAWYTIKEIEAQDTHIIINDYDIELTGPLDVRCQAKVAAGNGSCSAGFDFRNIV